MFKGLDSNTEATKICFLPTIWYKDGYHTIRDSFSIHTSSEDLVCFSASFMRMKLSSHLMKLFHSLSSCQQI
jgi:hypothetical protein